MFENFGIMETLLTGGLTLLSGWLGTGKIIEKLRGVKRKVDLKQKDIRDFANELREEGFTYYADALDELVVGDIVGFVGAIRGIRKMFRKDEAREKHFDGIFLGWVPKILADEQRRLPFIKEVNRWKQDNPRDAAMLEPPTMVPIASQPEALVPPVTEAKKA